MDVRAPRREADVLFAGNLFCDLVFGGLPGLPEPGGEVFADSFSVSAGGTANRCVASARLGLRTGVAATLGDDLFGRHLLNTLRTEDNLDLSWLRLEPSAPTPVSVSVANDRDRSFITYDQSPSGCPEELPGELPRVRACHLPVDSPLPQWAGQLRAAGTLLVGGVGWDRTETWSRTVLDRIADVDVFCPNEIEAMRYTRTASPLDAAKVLAERVPLAVVTMGPAGAVAIDGRTGEHAHVPAVPVRVVDPTGAGDVFVAALIFAMLRDWPLATRLRFAAVCAAMSVRALGGASSAPTWPEIHAFLAELPREDALIDAVREEGRP